MKEDQEFKHVCKFCSKSFPCGRSLGGHMRSHMTNNSAETDEKLSKKKLVSVNNVGSHGNTETGMEAGIQGGYVLRDKPKKTWRVAEPSKETSVHDKVCKECGKCFQSWKALFGHMKCHSDKEGASNNSLEEQDSWNCSNQKPVIDGQSDNETAAPSKGRRSKRKTRYMAMGTANSSTFSMSEIKQEQEVALSLMMLSRDVGHWAGLNSVAESSNNNSVFLEAKIEIKASICNEKKVKKLEKQKEKKLESATMDSEISQTEDGQTEFCGSGMSKPGVLDSEFCKDPHKRSKFECTTCNKIFHSYQALGGHRASHKKTRGCCFASRIDQSSENSIETENSPNSIADSKLVKSIGDGTAMAHSATDRDYKAEISYGVKKHKGHECPICLKVFPSGQALGGHKRSHLVPEAKNKTIVIQNPMPEIRDFLDLNLPAPVEEETSVHVGFKPWWVGSSHKHEALVGLISN